MHVLLVGAELEENLALRYLAASLEAAGHTASFATFDRAEDAPAVLAAVRRERPDVVGMSMTFQFRAQEFGALAQAVRADGYRGHVTVGGHFPTFAWHEVLERFPAIDTVVRHEGEKTIVELCTQLARGGTLGGVLGLARRTAAGALVANAPRPLAENLDALPFPKRVGAPQLHLGIPAAFLVGTRGCYGHCTFCCIHAWLKSAGGTPYRARSPENVADEMAELRSTRGARMFVFHDDDFFTRDHERDLARVTALRDALRARGVDDVALVVKARPDDVDEKVFGVLEEIGLLRVYLGIESGSTQGLRTLGRGVDLETNRRALRFLRDRGIYVCFNMLVFDPESTLDSLRESFRFLRAWPMVPMNFCRTEIYVGTPLMQKLAKEKRLIGDAFGWDYAMKDPRAERAFRVFARAFLDRNFRCDGLMNSTLGLGYHLHLLATFYPRLVTRALRERVDAIVSRVNVDCVTRMESIFDFAESAASEDRARFEDFANEATEATLRANRDLEREVADATNDIVRLALSPAPARRSATPVLRALSAASLALAPLACERATPPPPDPLPQPTMIGGPPDASPSATAAPTPSPQDPLPPPTIWPNATTPPDVDAARPPPPPDPLPPPTVVPTPTKTAPPPPPPDPLPPPHVR